MNIKRAFNISLLFLVTVLVPVVVVLTAVRIVIHPWYLEFEYHTPGFPADPYGFTLQERLQYARLAVDYLLNDQGIQFLADLHFPAGQQAPENSCQFMEDCTRLFNDRELEHMLDVKRVVGAAFRVWLAGLALLVIGGLIAWRMKAWKDYRLALSRGGWLTIALLGAIIVLAIIAFSTIFVAFHEVFFPPGTWTFYYSDTLIRLFPQRFWRDTFLMVGGLSVLMGLVLAIPLRPKKL